MDDVTVVVATRDRRSQLLGSLARLRAGAGAVPVVVLDNASTDGTADAVRATDPDALVISLDRNEGAVARNIGAATATTPLVAFCDDDSWWAPGSLARAAAHFREHPDLSLVAARVLVGPDEHTDPVSARMAGSTLEGRAAAVPGRPVLGFLACSAMVRRDAFLAVGGFSRVLGFLGEEDLVAWDLADGGWQLRYFDDVVVHHHPQPSGRSGAARTARLRRNATLSAVLRRPPAVAVRAALPLAIAALHDRASRRELVELVGRVPAALRHRRRLGPQVEADLRLLATHRRTEVHP